MNQYNMDRVNHNLEKPPTRTASPAPSISTSRATTMRDHSQKARHSSERVEDDDHDLEKLPSHGWTTDLRLAPTRSAPLTIHSQNQATDHTEHVDSSSQANGLTKTLSRLRTADSIDPGPPPDGGKKAWATACLAHLVLFNTWGFINSFGLFQTYYVGTLHLGSNSAVSWIGGMQIFMLFFLGTFAGRATDAGFFRLTFALGSFIYLGSMLALSWSKTYWQVFLAQGVGVGLGNGLVFVPSVAITSTYFLKNRGQALGLVTCGSGTGGLVFPAIAECLLPKVGFGWTIRVMTLVMGVTSAVCMIAMRPRLPPRKSGPLVEWSAFKEFPYTLYLVATFLIFWGLYIGIYFVGSFGRNVLGTSQSTSINLLLTLNGMGIVSRAGANYCSDRYSGPLNLMIPFSAVVGVLLFSWMAVTKVSGLWVFAIMYGIFGAGIQGLFPVVLTSLTTDPKKVGVRTGMGFTFVGVAALTGPPLAGSLIGTEHGTYVGMQAFAGSCLVSGAIVLVLCRRARCGGWQLFVKV